MRFMQKAVYTSLRPYFNLVCTRHVNTFSIETRAFVNLQSCTATFVLKQAFKALKSNSFLQFTVFIQISLRMMQLCIQKVTTCTKCRRLIENLLCHNLRGQGAFTASQNKQNAVWLHFLASVCFSSKCQGITASRESFLWYCMLVDVDMRDFFLLIHDVQQAVKVVSASYQNLTTFWIPASLHWEFPENLKLSFQQSEVKANVEVAMQHALL